MECFHLTQNLAAIRGFTDNPDVALVRQEVAELLPENGMSVSDEYRDRVHLRNRLPSLRMNNNDHQPVVTTRCSRSTHQELCQHAVDHGTCPPCEHAEVLGRQIADPVAIHAQGNIILHPACLYLHTNVQPYTRPWLRWRYTMPGLLNMQSKNPPSICSEFDYLG
jgi:hypothetical protein